ncbi:MAG: sulfatase-like hydrolase/transferase [Candidatus Hydrogenedens sp.]|nr:alkaline phosphatase family protein [Candidatus Hydrogenedentota bacterium]NLF58220.1 sulfatase-like hydrolase/transferase [Candidatus Hydrogenedens sp.]
MSRVLVIGLDGADPELARRWMGEGALPHLGALADRGAFLPLRSTMPPATFPAWTTCVTGVNPGRHGIFDFTEPVSGQHALRFVNSTYRRVPALWNTLSEAGARVAVVGVPATYPPEAVNGLMVSGFDSPVATAIDRSFVHPHELYPEVAGWRFADFQESRIGPGWHGTARARLLAKIAEKEAILLRLLRREPWDFFMAVFGESDTVSHHFWMFHDPASPRFREDSRFADTIKEVYMRLDEAVGKLVDAAGPDTLVLVVSDHGFTGAGDGVVHLNNRLAELGLLRFASGGKRGSLLKRAALAVVPERRRGALFRRFRTLAAGAEGRSRFGGIDWAKTRAWSEELGYFPSVRVNLAGRDPQGTLAPEAYDAFVAECCAQLEAWPHVEKAMPRTALYNGPHTDRAPDIILSLAAPDGYPPSCVRARGGPSFRRLDPAGYAGGKERGMNGVHRDPGLLLCSRPVAAAAPSLLDIAPTVFAALGVPGPPMEGVSLLGAPPAMEQGPEDGDGSREPEPYGAAEAAVLEARLRALGYLE